MKRLLAAIMSLVLCGFLGVEAITPVVAQGVPGTVTAAKKTTKKKKKKKKKKSTKKAKKKKKAKKTVNDTASTSSTASTPEGKIASIISDNSQLKFDIKDPKIEYDGASTYYVTYDYNLSSFTTSQVSQVISDYVDTCRAAYQESDINSIEFDVTTEMSDGSHQVVLMFRSEKDAFMSQDLTDFLSTSDYWGTFSSCCSNAWISPNISDKVKTESLTYVN